MKRFILASAALLAFSASADYIARQGKDYVRFSEGPCVLDVEQKDVMLSAVAVIGGKEFKACWAPISLQYIHVLYEDGDQGLVPVKDLKPAQGA